jgi:hypothetical protein
MPPPFPVTLNCIFQQVEARQHWSSFSCWPKYFADWQIFKSLWTPLKSFIGHCLEFQSTACPKKKLCVVDAVEYYVSLHIVLPTGNFLTDILAWVLCNMFCHLYLCHAVLLNHVPTAAYRSLKVLSKCYTCRSLEVWEGLECWASQAASTSGAQTKQLLTAASECARFAVFGNGHYRVSGNADFGSPRYM